MTVAFQTGAHTDDLAANYWLSQVTLRLRREVCWLWRERGMLAGAAPDTAYLPPFTDRTASALDISRHDQAKRTFFQDDLTARHLTALIGEPLRDTVSPGRAPRGSFTWLVGELALTPVDRFVLALTLLPLIDSAAGSVIATCLNDPGRVEPTLGLAQRLWDEPMEAMALFDPAHQLLRCGLLLSATPTWDSPLAVSGLVARQLLIDGAPLPASMKLISPEDADTDATGVATALAAARAATTSERHLVPIVGPRGAHLAAAAAACAHLTGRDLVAVVPGLPAHDLAPALTTAWLRGAAVYVPLDRYLASRPHDETIELPLPSLPVTVFVGLTDRSAVKRLAGPDVTPALHVPALTYAERLDCWRRSIPPSHQTPELAAALAEAARRFRYEPSTIARIAQEVAALDRPPTGRELMAMCREDIDVGSLAQEVSPRFGLVELMLPAQQTRQIAEIVAAMRNLTRVHYEWNTARAWNEGGLAALFAGPSGTGKTMAAEALARELTIPMYRIDLSQVVNKYIGETEKNLRQLFDAADAADIILFFDEADSLFGKRTEVQDAHDRYANLEISYLLERMERFKGLAILATNRKKDFDEAMLRRLRFVVDFPMPGQAERLRIWQGVIPDGVDAGALDFPFLAQRFPLAGGHIRSIVFHACLQCAAHGAARVLTMPAIVRAIRREYDKLDRAMSLDQFGRYASLIAEEMKG